MRQIDAITIVRNLKIIPGPKLDSGVGPITGEILHRSIIDPSDSYLQGVGFGMFDERKSVGGSGKNTALR